MPLLSAVNFILSGRKKKSDPFTVHQTHFFAFLHRHEIVLVALTASILEQLAAERLDVEEVSVLYRFAGPFVLLQGTPVMENLEGRLCSIYRNEKEGQSYNLAVTGFRKKKTKMPWICVQLGTWAFA